MLLCAQQHLMAAPQSSFLQALSPCCANWDVSVLTMMLFRLFIYECLLALLYVPSVQGILEMILLGHGMHGVLL